MSLPHPREFLPDALPLSTLRTAEAKTFSVVEHDDGSTSTKYVYKLDKAPVKSVDAVGGEVNGHLQMFTEGEDYVVIDDDGDGKLDSIDFSVGGDEPDANGDLYVEYVAESIMSRYVTAHYETVADLEPDIETAIESHQIEKASGDDLDRLGALFGELGKRRGRSDAEYRAFLKSIVQSFRGRGTKPGMKFAIAAGIGTDPENIVIEEDFQQVGYEIRVETDDTSFLSSAINDMAELADPSGVALLSPPIIVLNGETALFSVSQESTVVEETVGLGGGLMSMDGGSTLG